MSKFPRLSEIVRRLGGSPKKDDCTPVIDWTKIEEREPPSLPHDVNDITSKMSRSYEHAADEGHFYISEIETATKDNNEYYKISGWINKHNPCVPGHSRASYSGISCEYILEFKLVDGASRLSTVSSAI